MLWTWSQESDLSIHKSIVFIFHNSIQHNLTNYIKKYWKIPFKIVRSFTFIVYFTYLLKHLSFYWLILQSVFLFICLTCLSIYSFTHFLLHLLMELLLSYFLYNHLLFLLATNSGFLLIHVLYLLFLYLSCIWYINIILIMSVHLPFFIFICFLVYWSIRYKIIHRTAIFHHSGLTKKYECITYFRKGVTMINFLQQIL